MKKKLVIVFLIYAIIMVICGVIIVDRIADDYRAEKTEIIGEQNISVELNEVKQKIDSGDSEAAKEKCDEIVKNVSCIDSREDKNILLMWVFVVVNILFICSFLIYIYVRILKPFEDMKSYAGEISKGNMDVKIKVDRGNYFGDFTWAFDNMRKEIVKSRNAEKNAIENNKTVIATLSHDIKTPVSSIRAYAEAFEANMDSTPEKRQKYLSVLMEKCDEVTNLTNDLFIHSISEMNKLEVTEEEVDIVSLMDTDVRALFVNEDEVDIILPDEKEHIVKADRKRLLQVMENLKSNAEKYAKTKVEISLETEPVVKIHFRDFGQGLSDEEIPFVTGKFYRGKNIGDENGSGLGLYIVDELVRKMGGKLTLLSRNPGLEVIIELKD